MTRQPVGRGLRATVLAMGVLAAAARQTPAVELTLLSESAARLSPRNGDYERFIRSGDRERRYEVHVPPSYDGKTPVPLVLDFHGGGGNATAARNGTKMDGKSDSAGFIVVYPDGTGRFPKRFLTWNGGFCCGYASQNEVDDVGFTRDLLDDVAKFFRVDAKRVYSTGLSNGAIMSYRLACELSDRIAAIAPVSATMSVDRCSPSRPVPVLHIHGTADENAPYNGGMGRRSIARVSFRPVPECIARWVEVDGCDPKPVTTVKGNVRTDVYRSRASSVEVVLVTIEGGGHAWPGGRSLLPERMVGPDVSGFDANDLIWDFFKKYRLP